MRHFLWQQDVMSMSLIVWRDKSVSELKSKSDFIRTLKREKNWFFLRPKKIYFYYLNKFSNTIVQHVHHVQNISKFDLWHRHRIFLQYTWFLQQQYINYVVTHHYLNDGLRAHITLHYNFGLRSNYPSPSLSRTDSVKIDCHQSLAQTFVVPWGSRIRV